MPLALDQLTPKKAAEFWNHGYGGTPGAMVDQLALGGVTPNTNGMLYQCDLTGADGGSAILTLTGTIHDRFAIAPGGTSGPAAQTFDVWVEVEDQDGAFYVLGTVPTIGTPVIAVTTGTLLDGRFADGRFGASNATQQMQAGGKPKILVRTNTSGVLAFSVTRYGIDDNVATSSAAALKLIAHGEWALAPYNRRGLIWSDFD